MTCKPKTLISIEDAYMRRLIHTTGISTVQARDLVTMLGCDLSSLIRGGAPPDEEAQGLSARFTR